MRGFRFFSACLVAVLLLVVPGASSAQSASRLTPSQRAALDSLLRQDVPAGAPGVAVGIVSQGEVLYTGCAGLAELPTQRPIDARTRFNLASNGKQFTALVILLLAEEKKLALTDDIRTYFPTLYPDIREAITIQHLLTHTSGIRDVYDLWALQGITWWQQTLDNTDALRLLHRQRALNFAPGSAYRYSNSNYILLAEIAAKAAGRSFAAITDELFRRLRMPDTSFEPDYRRIRGPIALPYFNFDTWTGYRWRTNLHGDGNLFSTLADQLQWEKVVQRAGDGLISPVTLARSQQLVADGPNQPYGFGLEFGAYHGQPYRFHEGATGAWKATTVRFTNPDLALVTLTNSGKVVSAPQTRQMADVLRPRPAEPQPAAPALTDAADSVTAAELVGIYQNEDNFSFRFVQRPAGVFLVRAGRNDVQLERTAPNVFQQVTDPTFRLAFTRNAQQELQVTAYHPSHAPYTLTRPAADWPRADYAAWNGRYQNIETGVGLTVDYQTGRTYRLRLGKQEMEGELITPQKMLADGYVLTLAEPTALLLTSGRIQRVQFARRPGRHNHPRPANDPQPFAAVGAPAPAALASRAESTEQSAVTPPPAWTDHTRLLPERLRGIPTGLSLTHSPSPVYPVADPQKPGQYLWHHSTTVRAEAADLEIVEAGSFIWYSADGWQKNIVLTPTDFAGLFKCPGGKLRQGQAYTFAENDRFAESADRVYPGDAMWYILARDPRTGQLYKGLGLVETEGLRK